ncbi:hypothetical protein JB92DRAFT_2837643 [Gautieria morchelliformis]|nr:hypothetical protein JB92DRAFT_2837643 [Gautieria morchelliformis]
MSWPLLNIPMVQVRTISLSYAFISDFKVVLQKSRYFRKNPCVVNGGVTLTHYLFDEKFVDSPDGREGGSEVNAMRSTDDDDQDPFSFATWLVTDAARDAMNAVKHTHDFSPLPAFDVNGDPIVPSQYDRLLKGAVVEVHFALTSWVFAGRSAKAMSIPLIREMLVISPPKPPVASPMKRKNVRDGHKKKIHA